MSPIPKLKLQLERMIHITANKIKFMTMAEVKQPALLNADVSIAIPNHKSYESADTDALMRSGEIFTAWATKLAVNKLGYPDGMLDLAKYRNACSKFARDGIWDIKCPTGN